MRYLKGIAATGLAAGLVAFSPGSLEAVVNPEKIIDQAGNQRLYGTANYGMIDKTKALRVLSYGINILGEEKYASTVNLIERLDGLQDKYETKPNIIKVQDTYAIGRAYFELGITPNLGEVMRREFLRMAIKFMRLSLDQYHLFLKHDPEEKENPHRTMNLILTRGTLSDSYWHINDSKNASLEASEIVKLRPSDDYIKIFVKYASHLPERDLDEVLAGMRLHLARGVIQKIRSDIEFLQFVRALMKNSFNNGVMPAYQLESP